MKRLPLLLLLTACQSNPSPPAPAEPQPTIAKAAHCVKAGDLETRCAEFQAVLKAVKQGSEPALDEVARALGQGDLAVIALALVREAQARRPTLTEAVVPLVNAPQPYIRRQALMTLTGLDKLPKSALDAAVKRLDDSDAEVRHQAITLLGSHHADPQQSGPALLSLLKRETSPEVRRSLINRLGRLSYPPAIDALLERLAHPTEGPAAALALTYTSDPAVMGRCLTHIEKAATEGQLAQSHVVLLVRLARARGIDPGKLKSALDAVKAALATNPDLQAQRLLETLTPSEPVPQSWPR